MDPMGKKIDHRSSLSPKSFVRPVGANCKSWCWHETFHHLKQMSPKISSGLGVLDCVKKKKISRKQWYFRQAKWTWWGNKWCLKSAQLTTKHQTKTYKNYGFTHVLTHMSLLKPCEKKTAHVPRVWRRKMPWLTRSFAHLALDDVFGVHGRFFSDFQF